LIAARRRDYNRLGFAFQWSPPVLTDIARARIVAAQSGVGPTIGWMRSSSELVAVDLTSDERSFIQHAMYQWQFSATATPFPIHVLGLSNWEEFDELTGRLSYAIIGGQALTSLDWARVLYLTECSWASEMVGAGLDFATVSGFSDMEAVSLLRGLQRKIGLITTADLLFPGSSRCLKPADGG
jgi:hypothetical protein